jgi:hypothetical protein
MAMAQPHFTRCSPPDRQACMALRNVKRLDGRDARYLIGFSKIVCRDCAISAQQSQGDFHQAELRKPVGQLLSSPQVDGKCLKSTGVN